MPTPAESNQTCVSRGATNVMRRRKSSKSAFAGRSRSVSYTHLEGFKAVHDTVTPINPEQPDLGPKSNQIIIWNTRADGRRQLNARFAQTFGTVNNFSHNSS